jgi:glycosyltransferase 2 family protein
MKPVLARRVTLPDPPRRRRWDVRTWIGYLVAVAGLIWVFHDVQLGPMLGAIRDLRWTWVALAIGADILTYTTQGLRWRLLLKPIGELRWLDATRAIYAGLFANEVLPMRPGEVLRAFLVSKQLNTYMSAVFPSIVVERLFDGVWLAIGIGVTAMALPLPASLLHAGDAFGVLVLVATGLLLFEVLRVRPVAPAQAVTTSIPIGTIERFRRHFREIGRRRETYVAFGASAVLLLGQIVAFWLVGVAYGPLRVGFWAAAATLIIIHLGTAIPNTPANVGTYQFFCVLALTLLGVDKTIATGFSVVVFIVLTVPLWLIGSLALGRSGTSLARVRMRMHEQ